VAVQIHWSMPAAALWCRYRAGETGHNLPFRGNEIVPFQ
jgi:hypothetical protein